MEESKVRLILKRSLTLVFVLFLAAQIVSAGGATESGSETTTTAASTGKYNESPVLAAKVQAGELPAVEDRLPPDPVVVEPIESIGKYGGTLQIGLGGTYSWYGDGQSALGPETLWRIKADYTGIEANVIREWEWSNEGKTLVIHVVEGAKWSDGEPFNADAIMFWYEDMLLNEELSPSGPATRWKPGGEVMKLTKLDNYSIRYDFAVPYPVIEIIYAHYQGGQYTWVPGHYLKQFHATYTDKDKLTALAKEEGFDEWYQLYNAKNRMASVNPAAIDLPTMSAYMVVASSPESHTLVRNPYYWKVDPAGNQLPYIDEVHLGIYTDREVMVLKAIQGEFDLFGQNSALADYPVYQENKEKGGYEVYNWVDANANLMAWNFNLTIEDPVKREVFRDRRFRIAFSHSLNRDEINETQFFGLATPMAATAHPQSAYYKQEYADAYIEYDPDKANDLLDEMGLDKRGSDGYRLMKDGRTLEITLEYPPDTHTWAPPIVELVVDYQKDIGIKLNVKADDRTLYGQRVADNKVEMNEWATVAFTTTLLTDPRCFVPFRLGDETIWYRQWAVWYTSGGEQGEEPIPEVMDLINWYEELITIVDQDERAAVLDKILKSHAENLWTIGTIGNTVKPVLVSVNLGNVPKEGVHGYDAIRMQPNHPETFFFKN